MASKNTSSIKTNFHNLFSIGGSNAFKLSSELQNPFWKGLMHIWAEICKILPVENIGTFIGRGFFFKGIRIVFDIIGKNVEFKRLNN